MTRWLFGSPFLLPRELSHTLRKTRDGFLSFRIASRIGKLYVFDRLFRAPSHQKIFLQVNENRVLISFIPIWIHALVLKVINSRSSSIKKTEKQVSLSRCSFQIGK